MSYLKGNYSLDKSVGDDKADEQDADNAKAFERFARERLGGSIAFVMKDRTFVWSGDEARQNPKVAEPPAAKKS